MASRGESSPSSTFGWVKSSTGMAGAGAPAAHRERRRRLQRAAALRWPGGGRGVGELHGGEEKLARGSIGGEEGRGRGLRDGVVLGGDNGGRGGVPGRGEGSGSLAWGGMERGGAGT